MKRIACLLMLCVIGVVHADEDTLFQPADLTRIADLSDPALSHDGNWVAYTVSSANVDDDQSHSDLWRVRYDGSQRTQLTHTRDSNEWQPRWSNDGAWIAFLSNRPPDADESGDDATTQVWLMPADGGEARRLTDFADGVEDFVWSPDAKQLAVIAIDPEFPADAEKPKNPPPIVTERYQFKEDGAGYLDARRKHLYLFDIASGKAELLTPGAHDEQLPAWSPDGKTIAYVTKRGADPDRHLNYDIYLIAPKAGARERQLTTFPGADLDPYWESYPAWSPDSTRIAYLQSGEDKWVYYAPWQLAVIDVASGKSRIPAAIDRCFTHPRWSADGRHVFALVEQSLVTHVARIDLADGSLDELDHGARFDYELAVAGKDRIVVLGGDDLHPYALAAVEAKGLRALGDHNAWLAEKTLAKAEAIRFDSSDGTTIEGLLVKPVGYRPGTRYPTIVRLHGGPVYQFSREFMADWQVYAANGFAVLAINPRGSCRHPAPTSLCRRISHPAANP